MKRITQITTALAFLAFFLPACKKSPLSSAVSSDQNLIQSAKTYFESHLQNATLIAGGNNRISAVKQPYWQDAYCTASSNGRMVVIPVFYQKNLAVRTTFSGSQPLSLNSLTNLVMYRKGAEFYSELVTLFPDSVARVSPAKPFSGIIFSETWQGQLLKKYKMSAGMTFTENPSSPQEGKPAQVATTGNKEADVIIATCTTIYGFNYSADDPSDTYSWSESGGCDYQFLPEDPGGGSGIPPSNLSSILRRPFLLPTVIVRPPTNIIGNVQDYMKCFSNYGGSDHTYQVSVCVDQPDPGTREAWALTSSGVAGSSSGANPVDAGHTFLVLTENLSGYSIVRNVGFYPQSNVYPWSTSAQGQLNNDDGHTYNISLTITVDNGQFFNILNYISQGNNSGYMYDLNTNNCTSFALHALQAGGISLPATVGSWPDGGFGYDPGDLGEDIRNMSLSSNMTRNSTYNDHPNKYTCN